MGKVSENKFVGQPILTHIAAKNRTKVKYGLFLC